MPEPRPPAQNDIRLRKILDETLVAPHWPEGFVMMRAAILAMGRPMVLATKGTVRDARGLTSST